MTKTIDALVKSIAQEVAACDTVWQLPWRLPHALPMNAQSGRRYRGINVLNLSLTAQLRDYRKPYWLTFRQAIAMGGCVRKGERGTKIVFMKPLPVEESEPERHVWRVWTVFNIAQINGLELPPPVSPSDEHDRTYGDHAFTRRFLDCLETPVEHMDCTPCYIPAIDRINLPAESAFIDTRHLTASQNYLATLLHEHVHATGHPKRLARVSTSPPTPSDYAFEELVAEIGSALLARLLGLEQRIAEDHIAYLAHWQSLLDKEPNQLIRAASLAEKAIACLEAQAGVRLDADLPAASSATLPPSVSGSREDTGTGNPHGLRPVLVT